MTYSELKEKCPKFLKGIRELSGSYNGYTFVFVPRNCKNKRERRQYPDGAFKVYRCASSNRPKAVKSFLSDEYKWIPADSEINQDIPTSSRTAKMLTPEEVFDFFQKAVK